MGVATVTSVCTWAQSARPGERVVYHLRDARVERAGHRPLPPRCASAYAAHAEGLVFLAQRLDRKRRLWLYEATRISERTAKTLRLLDSHGRPAAEGLHGTASERRPWLRGLKEAAE